ncbi:ATP-binding cassette domain-containing protein [Leucobacter sp. BZR 635]
MFTCEQLTVVARGGASAPVLRNLSLAVDSGRLRAVVGGPGSGKSMLGDVLRGALAPNLQRRTGVVRIDDREPAVTPERAAAHQVAWFGEACETDLLASASVGERLRSVLSTRFPGEPCDDLTLVAALARLGINDARMLEQHPRVLSPAMLRRVGLAIALARPTTVQQPKLVVLDEPLRGLDAAATAEVLAALSGTRRAIQATVLLLTRDLVLAQRLADEISVIEGGQIVETFTPERAVNQPRAGLRAAAWDAARLGAGSAVGTTRTARPATRALLQASRSPERALLELREFSVLLSNGQQAARPLTLRIAAGEGLAITGPAGSGKSMLARALVGGLRPSSALRISGELLLGGQQQAPRAAARTPEERRAIQLISYDPERTPVETHTVRTQLRRAVRRARPTATPSAVGARVASLLRLVGLGAEGQLRRLCDLSPQAAHRVALARTLAGDPDVLIWDGQAAGRGADEFVELCGRVREATGVTLILITRDSDVARAVTGRELQLDRELPPRLRDGGAAHHSVASKQAA